MTEVQVRNYMNRAYRAKELIGSMQEELLRLQALLDETAAYNSRPNHRQGSFLARIIEKEQRQQARIAEYIEATEQIHQVLAAIEDVDQRILLQLRYLNFKTWDEIAEQLHYSTVWVFRLHKKALAAAGRVIVALEQQTAVQ